MSWMKKFGTTAVVMSAGFALLSACGGGDNFGSEDVAGLSIEGWTSNSQQLDMMGVASRNVQQSEGLLILRSSDKATLKVTKLEWVARPDWLATLGSADNTLDADGSKIPCDPSDEVAACGAYPGSICLSVENSHCRTTDLPATPIEIPSGLQEQIHFVVKKGADAADCPVPGSHVPEDIKENYCGELLIETNAKNNAGIVKDGNARLYFLADGTSGKISISPSSFEFSNVKPGVSQNHEITVTNSGRQPLFINQTSIYPTNGMLAISPEVLAGAPITIEAESSKTFTLTLNPPASASEGELNFVSTLQIDSSSADNAAIKAQIAVTTDAGNAPQLVIDPSSLSFIESNSQTITIENSGKTVGRITSLSVSPASVRSQYKVLYQGNILFDDGTTQGLPLSVPRMTTDEPSVIEFEVQFVAPTDPGESTLGTLTIRHNDANAGGKAEIALLGNSTELALGKVVPAQYTFVAGTAGQIVDFAVYNSGTDPLEISDTELEMPPGAEDGLFTVSNMVGTIPAGGLLKGTATYTGTTKIRRNTTLKLISNTAGDAQDMTLALVAQPAENPVTLDPTITPSFATNASINDVTTFTVSDASETANLQGSTWLVLERPAGSSAFLTGSGESATFKADVAGSYKISVIVPNGENINKQVFLEFNAVE